MARTLFRIALLVPLAPLLLAPAPPARAELAAPTDLAILADSAGFVTLEWRAVSFPPGLEYMVLVNDLPGVHPEQTSWNGYEAAFSFTTDDGRPDNMVWARAFAPSGSTFTAFITTDFVSEPGFLTDDEINALHAMGHEIAGHSVTHPYLTTDKALRLQYVGSSSDCWLLVSSGIFKTYLDNLVLDLNVSLNDSATYYLDQLVAALDAQPDYVATLDNYAIHGETTESHWLDPIYPPGVSIKAAPRQLTTRKGSSDEELEGEVVGCKADLESMIGDSTYVCRTFSYPFHVHDQREMNAVMAAGYIAARDGYYGTRPSGSPADIDSPNRVDLYEKPETYTAWTNQSSEADTRLLVRDFIATLKANRDWGHARTAHTTSDWDSAHVAWMLDEMQADGGVWVAPFGTVGAYARRFGIAVSAPIVPGSDPPVCRVKLGGFDPLGTHFAVVVAVDDFGDRSAWSNEVVFENLVGVADGAPTAGAAARLRIVLRPNPSHGPVSFEIALPSEEAVSLVVCDLSGRVARRLLDGPVPAGERRIGWDAADERGRPLAAGLYVWRAEAGGSRASGRLAIVR